MKTKTTAMTTSSKVRRSTVRSLYRQSLRSDPLAVREAVGLDLDGRTCPPEHP
jgi:hypothetical protein